MYFIPVYRLSFDTAFPLKVGRPSCFLLTYRTLNYEANNFWYAFLFDFSHTIVNLLEN